MALARTPAPDFLRTKASRCICEAAATKLGDSRNRPISGKDWEVFRSEIGKYLAAREGYEGRVEDGLREGLWFLFVVAGQRAAKARRRSNNGNIVAHRFFHSVGFGGLIPGTALSYRCS